jgi:hypothetical protein
MVRMLAVNTIAVIAGALMGFALCNLPIFEHPRFEVQAYGAHFVLPGQWVTWFVAYYTTALLTKGGTKASDKNG